MHWTFSRIVTKQAGNSFGLGACIIMGMEIQFQNNALDAGDEGEESEIQTINYKIRISLVSAKWGPKLTIALQSITIRKGGSGPNRFASDKIRVSRRSLLPIMILQTRLLRIIALFK
jgi:hypothetical protein